MIVSRGGFSDEDFGAALGVSSGNGSDHDFVTVDSSRTPLFADAGRPSLMIDGACIALYAAVASRPAYL